MNAMGLAAIMAIENTFLGAKLQKYETITLKEISSY